MGKLFLIFLLILTALLGLFSFNAFAGESTEYPSFNGAGFFQSVIIIVREGFEAILIIGAISAYLVVSKNQDKLKTVYVGLAAAIIASLITAFLIEQIFFFSTVQQELLEGVTLIIAAFVLLFVTNWMLAKAEAMRWQKYIKGKVEQAISNRNSFALGLVSFFAVYREGFETILFYKALLLQTNNSSDVFVGFFVGTLILAGLFFSIRKLGVKLPINVFFLSTSVLLFIFAFSFVGSGVHELQEAGIVGETGFDLLPKIKFLGIYPTTETGLSQLVVLFFGAIMAYVHVFKHHDLMNNLA